MVANDAKAGKKAVFPKVPSKAWRTLRARATAAPSTKFTPAFVSAQLGMASADSADRNVVRPLRQLGLFDESGALTGRGNKWRVDATYPEACQEMLDAIYPGDLASLTDDNGAPDKAKIRTWFDQQGFGDSNAQQMAATYVMIAAKQPPDPSAPDPKKTAKAPRAKASPQAKAAASTESTVPPTTTPPSPPSTGNPGPTVHLDIQIHIPVGAGPDQIEQIFASMAKHLYRT